MVPCRQKAFYNSQTKQRVKGIAAMSEPSIINSDVQIVETGKRLSECLLWRLQEEFYANAGLDAWDVIPFYPTSNASIGALYAEIIVRFLQDTYEMLDPTEPVYILELATGSGAFSFYLMKELQRKLVFFEKLQALNIRYVMTDFTDAIVKDWTDSEKLNPFLKQNMLDFAVFRPEEQQEIQLIRSGQVLAPGTLKNPVIAIANYFFDSIRQDQFRVENHQLLETRLTFRRELQGLSPDSAVTLAQLQKTETFQPAEKSYYSNDTLNRVLEHYRQHFQDASILFPIGAFRCIENLSRLSGDKLLLLAADKGFTRSDYMEGHKEQFYTPHAGAFSYMVNFDAIARYFDFKNGFYMVDEGNTSILNMLAGGTLAGFTGSLEQTRYYFEENVARQDAANHVNLARRLVNSENYDALGQLRGAMGMIQLSNFDAMVFYECAGYLLQGLDDPLFVTDYRTLLSVLERVRENIFSLDPKANVYHKLEKIYFKLRHHAECKAIAHEAIQRFGPTAHSLVHLAACLESEGNALTALRHYQHAAQLDPGSEIIEAAIERLSI